MADDEVVLGRDNIALGGEELENYCRKHGLCSLCAQVRTHKRVFRLVKKNQFQPLTVQNRDDGEFTVYKGYCVIPGCFTLDQAKRLLGEIGPSGRTHLEGVVEEGEGSEQVDSKKSNGLSSRLLRRNNSRDKMDGDGQSLRSGARGKSGPSRRKGGGHSFDGLTGFSNSTATTASLSSGSRRGRGGASRSGSSGSGGSSSLKSEIRRADDDVSVASSMTSSSKVRMSLHQLLRDNAGTMLDLSSTRLHHVHITELVNSFSVAATLQSLILENCRLNDNEVEVIANGLAGDGMSAPIRQLSFRSNRMGNRGAVSLQSFFGKTSHLEELDMSKNQIGSRGATATLHAFRDNSNCLIKMLNFAHNEIWDPDDGTFFATNATVELVNLEGNFIHDEGIEAIAKGIRANYRRCKLTKLFLGWNGIGDEGCVQLAKMLETNTSLETLGLGENDITSIGARAILSSLAFNSTLRDITGLYHNQIDRKFIIAAIKRLLLTHVENVSQPFGDDEAHMATVLESSMSAMDTLAEPLGTKLPPPDELSEGSLDWADKLYASGDNVDDDGNVLKVTPAPSNKDPIMIPVNDGAAEKDPTAPERASGRRRSSTRRESFTSAKKAGQSHSNGIIFKDMEPPKTNFDRLMVLQSAPLAYFNRFTSLHHAVPLHDFDHETAVLRNALRDANKVDATIELEVEPGHPDRLRSFFKAGTSRVLHLSCYGHPDRLAFENGAGDIQSMTIEELTCLVKLGTMPLQLVVVNSFHSGRIGKAFIEAGVPHVVCCHHTEVFRDKAASAFVKNLYRGLASNRSLKQAFYMAQEAVRVEEISKHVDRYVLLPRTGEDDDYHDVPIFYTQTVPEAGLKRHLDGEDYVDEDEEPFLDVVPHLPKHFIGREVDMYEVLEALRVDDVVRVGGAKGSGKSALVAAVCRYISQRRKMFKYDNIFWLPAANGITPEEDTLFGDLCSLMDKMLSSDIDLLDDEEAMECQDRISIELEGQRTIMAIDGRKFDTEIASQNLEEFLGQLLNNSEAVVKVILITFGGEDVPQEQGSVNGEEEDTIRLGPIDFKSASLLFGEVSRFITANGCPAAQSPDEFAALMVPPSVAKLQDQSRFSSSRRTELLSAMGNGNPSDVIQAGKRMPASTFIQLIGMANTPEVRVDSNNTLEIAIDRWTQERDRAVQLKNYLRANDLEKVLIELDTLHSKFPSLDNLIAKEKALQQKLTAAMSDKQYREGNKIKREILALKRLIMQEKRAAPEKNEQTAADRMTDLQAQVQSIMKLANSSFSDMDVLPKLDATEATFTLGSAYHHCEVNIYCGSVVRFDPGNDLGAAICWTNECCDMTLHESGRIVTEYGGPNLAKDISSLPGITKTRWGLAKCGTGNAVIVGPGNYDDLTVHCIILAVGPLSPSCDDVYEPDDEDSLHYIQIMMRSCIRSSLILAKHSQVQSVAFPTLTTKVDTPTYDRTLLMGLKILIEEAKHSDLNTLDIVASTEEESSKLIAMAMDMGLVIQEVDE